MAFPVYATEGGVANQTIAANLAQYTRGTGVVLEVDFFDDAPANTTPSVPANPAQYPAWTIVDPAGVQVASGVGIPGSAVGRWSASYFIPPDAPLSTQSNKWRIIWTMVTQTARQLRSDNPFDIIELRTPDTLPALRSHSYVSYPGESERLIFRLPRRPDELSVKVYAPVSYTDPTPIETPIATGSLAASSITEIQEQNLFSYIFDTGPLATIGEHQVVWMTRQTVTSPRDTTVQKMVVPPQVFFSLAISLKTLIDKLQKKPGKIQAYTDSDLYEYILRGLGLINSVTPITNWSLCNFPWNSFLARFLIEAAAWYGLQAQQLLSSELAFSFSGQSVTLDVDQTSVYGEAIQRLYDDLTGSGRGSLGSAKRDLNRATTPAALVGGRMSRNYGSNFVFRVAQGQAGSFPSSFLTQSGFNAIALEELIVSLGLPVG